MAGLDPAIRSNIEITQFFLDGRVKHGHEKGDISPRRVDEGVPLAPIESEKLTARLKPPRLFLREFQFDAAIPPEVRFRPALGKRLKLAEPRRHKPVRRHTLGHEIFHDRNGAAG